MVNRPTSFRRLAGTAVLLKWVPMAFPWKTCVVCDEEFELRPDKPGFANRCPECSAPEAEAERAQRKGAEGIDTSDAGVNAERRKAIRNLLYRKDS